MNGQSGSRILPDEAAELVSRAAAGDSVAWGRLVSGFLPLIWSTVRQYRLTEPDAADVVQTAWLRLVQHLDRLDDPSRVAAWLVTTVRREALRVSRQANVMLATEDT